ncbi:MAG: biotin/lipoyl-binding protein [Syntrophaceae bacterium]|nr:biotin/lipoyl-binding protein [Syntrophaceae bacterium]
MNSKILFWLKRQKILLVVIVLLIAVTLYTIKSRTLVVEQYTVTRGTVTAKIMGTGTLEARYQTTVSAKIQGRITELTVDQNDHVKKDQLIAKLDEIELKQEVGI